MAQKADRHVLYQESVQCAESELDFVAETFRAIRKRRARHLREDFCGTANVACEWVRRHRDHTAVGVDLDAEVLAWGREHNVQSLPPAARKRIELLQEDVVKVKTRPVDVVLAMNFSYWILRDRDIMRRYFKHVRQHLTDDGIFFLDAYGGYDTFRVLRERTEYDKHTYIWHQASYNPINGEATCHIDFKFPDGSALRKAFSYTWRVWTLPEIREILAEAGFKRVVVYWQGTDEETGDGDGNFTPAEVGDPDAGWICYITAEK